MAEVKIGYSEVASSPHRPLNRLNFPLFQVISFSVKATVLERTGPVTSRPHVVARSLATKQSQTEIATPPPEARDDTKSGICSAG